MRRTATWIIATVTIMTIGGATTLAAADTPHRATIKVKPVATGLNGPSGFTFAPNGTIWYLERGTGEVHTLDPVTGADHLVFTIAGVDGSGERGALGIALHPRWPRKKVVYVYVTRLGGGQLQNQLVRFRVNGGTGGELRVVLLNTDRDEEFAVEVGDRIAQLVILAVPQVRLVEVDELPDSERSASGFGSSAVRSP